MKTDHGALGQTLACRLMREGSSFTASDLATLAGGGANVVDCADRLERMFQTGLLEKQGYVRTLMLLRNDSQHGMRQAYVYHAEGADPAQYRRGILERIELTPSEVCRSSEQVEDSSNLTAGPKVKRFLRRLFQRDWRKTEVEILDADYFKGHRTALRFGRIEISILHIEAAGDAMTVARPGSWCE